MAKENRIVPAVFAVQYYRRPTFELKVSGLPDQPGDFASLKLQFQGDYYFGKPVANGLVAVKLLGAATFRSSLRKSSVWMPTANRPSISPFRVAPSGSYRLLTTLQDETGRAVSRAYAIELRRRTIQRRRQPWPRCRALLPFDKELVVQTSVKEVTIEQGQWLEKIGKSTFRRFPFPVKDGRATIKFPAPGWYSIDAGADSAEDLRRWRKEHQR